MEDDSGTPLSADDIIPVLTSETALSPNPDNPYYLIQADKGMTTNWLFEQHLHLCGLSLFLAPEPITGGGSVNSTSKLI